MLSEIADYLKARVDDQMQWYSKKSAYNKKMYRYFQFIIIVVSAVIPLINLTATATPWAQHGALITTAILGSIIAIVTAFMQMEKYFESWILCRTTLESLKREKVLFQNNVGECQS